MATFRNPKPATADKLDPVVDLESGNYSGPTNVEVNTPPGSTTPPNVDPKAISSPQGITSWWTQPSLHGTPTATRAGRKTRRHKLRKTRRKGGKRIRKTHRRRR